LDQSELIVVLLPVPTCERFGMSASLFSSNLNEAYLCTRHSRSVGLTQGLAVLLSPTQMCTCSERLSLIHAGWFVHICSHDESSPPSLFVKTETHSPTHQCQASPIASMILLCVKSDNGSLICHPPARLRASTSHWSANVATSLLFCCCMK